MLGEDIPASVILQVQDEGADPERLDRVSRQLYAELRNLDGAEVEFVHAGPAPLGAKAGEAVTVGALALSVLPAVLPKLLEFLQAWVLRTKSRSVKVKADVGGRIVEVECSGDMSQDEMKAVISQALSPAAAKQEP